MTSIAPFPGFSSSSKLLIIHADDLGLCQSVNRAIFTALESGAVTSASIMAPCPYFREAAEWAARHPAYDIGVHSTLISEWKNYKWGPVSKGTNTPELVDESGHFWSKNSLLRAAPEMVEQEISAQVQMAKDAGVRVSHLDSHMLSVARPEYIRTYVKTARKFDLPFLIDEHWHACISPDDPAAAQDIVIKGLFQARPGGSLDSLEDFYASVVRNLDPGLHQLIVHPGFDDAELRAITDGLEPYGAAWRQKDLKIVMSDSFKSLLKENDIQLVNWTMLKSLAQTRNRNSRLVV
jgi:predicted glycoside hydrolase/deacetylase ChbG (UPF0249 family)